MARLGSTIRSLLRDEEAATAIEYGLIVALIGLSLMAVLTVLNVDLDGLYEYIVEMTGEAFNKAGG